MLSAAVHELVAVTSCVRDEPDGAGQAGRPAVQRDWLQEKEDRTMSSCCWQESMPEKGVFPVLR